MRTLQVLGWTVLLLFISAERVSVRPNAQTPPPQGAPTTPQTGGRGREPQGPPLVPTPALTAPPTPDKDGNFVIGPPYAPAPELTVKDGVPKGTIYEFTMDSKDSKIYPGIARSQPGAVVPYTRQVAVTFRHSTSPAHRRRSSSRRMGCRRPTETISRRFSTI